MDKCSCLNHEALTGVLKTVYLFLESQNFRETCETFLSESKGMGYEQLKQAIACILVLKPTADMVGVAHVDSSKTDMEIEADIVHEYDDTSLPNTYYGEPLCLRCLASDTLSSAEIAAGICPCKDSCRARKNVVETIDNTKNDIQTHNVLTRVVQEEVKLAAPMHQTTLELKHTNKEKEDHHTEEYHVTISRENLHETHKGDRDEVEQNEIEVKIVSSSSAVENKVNLALEDDDKDDKDLIRPASKPSILKTNVQVSGGHAEEVEVILRTEDYKENQPEQHENDKSEEPTLKPMEFVENDPFSSKTSLANQSKGLHPTSSVRFDLGGQIYAVSRETQIIGPHESTVITETVVEELPGETSDGPSSTITTHTVVVSPKKSSGSSTDTRSHSAKSVSQERIEDSSLRNVSPESKHEQFASKIIPVPDATHSSKTSLDPESGNVLQLEKCLEKGVLSGALASTRSAHTTAGVDAVERSASTHSLNARYQLDYSKVKRELRWGCPSVRAVLLQALRWRLTRSTPELRNEIMADYARHDLLSLHGAPKSHTTLVEEFLCSDNGKLSLQHEEGMARMVNAMASLTLGRDYLCQDHTLLSMLIIPLLMNAHPSKVELSAISSDYLWVALQKLSLRNNMRLVMIQSGLAEYLVTFLSQNHNLVSDYCLEYCLALFMNLCLHAETHNRLRKKSRDTVKFISDFLSANHDACLSYINGAMYSLFMDADIRKEAKHGHLDTKISEKSKFVDEETRQQLEVIFDVLNTNKSGPECNTCDCTDQDDEVDHLEDEIEYADLVHGTPDGENLLSLYRGESGLIESLTVPLTCVCRPATPCKKISAMERCPLSPDCERPRLRSDSLEKKVKASCFGLCKKSKGHETIWDEERVLLATEMCPWRDHVCCDDERIPVKEPCYLTTTSSHSVNQPIPLSVSATVIQGDNTISVVVEEKPAPGILAGSRRSLASTRPRSVTLPPAEKASVITVTSTKHDAISGTPSTLSVECRIVGDDRQVPPKFPSFMELEQVPSQISQPLVSLTDGCGPPCQISAKSSGVCQAPCRIDSKLSGTCPSGGVICTTACTQAADLTCGEIGTDCVIDEEATLTCQDCCNRGMEESSSIHQTSTHSLPTAVLSTSSKRDITMSPSIVSKKDIEMPDDSENEISVVVQSTHKSLRDGSTNTIITTTVKSHPSRQSIHETATASTAESYYAEPVTTIEPSPEPEIVLSQKPSVDSTDHEHVECDPKCPSRTEFIEEAHHKEEIPLKKHTSSGCCHSIKSVKLSSTKHIKSSKPSADSTVRPIDREHSFLKDNVECDPKCPSRTEFIEEAHHKEEIPLKKHTSSGCCHSLKNAKLSSTKHIKSSKPKPFNPPPPKPIKSHGATRKTSTKTSFRALEHVPSFLRDNIQYDITCSGHIETIEEISPAEVTSKKRTSSGCCAKRKSSEQSEKSLFSKCKLFDRSRADNVPPSFTRTTINQPSKIRLQYNPCEQCTDQSFTCKPYIFSQQTNSYQPFRPYCYNVTKGICRNPTCSCPNETVKVNVACSTCQDGPTCGNQGCSTRSKYTCECYNNMQEFSQSADLNRICRKS